MAWTSTWYFSTAARVTPKTIPHNVRVLEMIPGDLAARKAAVVVCSGGASTGYQALAEGTPIVAIPSNFDQLLAATAMCDAGAGVLLRAWTVTPAEVRAAVERVMREESFTQTAQRVAASFAGFDPTPASARSSTRSPRTAARRTGRSGAQPRDINQRAIRAPTWRRSGRIGGRLQKKDCFSK